MGLAGSASAETAPPTIACAVHAPAMVKAGVPIPLTVVLQNRGATKVAVLEWGTPFEDAWLQPFVTVRRDGAAVPYSGAMVKRGDPEFEEYFSLAPNERREASIDLALAFDLTVPGRYTIIPQLQLHDVVLLPTSLPRARANHNAVALACRSVTVTVTAR